MNRPIFYLTIGLPGAGKSTYAHTYYESIIPIIDIDYIKSHYDKLQDALDHCTNLANRYFKRQISFIWVSTSKNLNSLRAKIQSAANAGFDIEILYFNIDVHQAYHRVRLRSQIPESGREKIPEERLFAFEKRIKNNVEYIKEHYDLDVIKFKEIKIKD